MTTEPEPLRTLACPTCGAPLEIKVEERVIRCKYCTGTVENPSYQSPEPAEPPSPRIQVERSTITLSPRSFTPLPAPSKPALFAGVGMLAFILLVVFVGIGVLVFALTSNAGKLQAAIFPLQIHTPALLLETDGEAPNIVASTYDISTSSYALARLDVSSHQVLWKTLAQEDYLSIDALVESDALLYVVIEDRLIAIQLTDGTQAWETSLPDKLYSRCEQCVVIQKGQVLVLTMDNSLGAYDALTGQQAWEKSFGNTGNRLYPVSSGVALVYAIERGAAVGVLDATSGAEVVHFEPSCGPDDGFGDELSFYSNVLVDSLSQPAKLYAFYGLFNACVQRWDLSNGSLDWEYVEESENLDNSRSVPVLLANRTLFYVQGDQLRSLDSEAGQQMQILDQPEDYDLLPLLVDGERLLVRATRTRGSTRYEIWGYDLTNGQSLWKQPLAKSGPIDPPDEKMGIISDDESGWTYRLTPGGLFLITFQTEPNQVVIEQVNLDTGELTNPRSIPLGLGEDTDSYTIPERIDQGGGLAWYTIYTRLYAIDPESDTFPYQWP